MRAFLLRFVGLCSISCLCMAAVKVDERSKEPSVLYLTWMHDPSTTMTVQWHTKDTDPSSEILYRKAGESEWQLKEGVFNPLPKTNVLVHTVELEGLEPNTDYQFLLAGRKKEHLFRTLPKTLSRHVKFVIGGDAYVSLSTLRKMNAQIASRSPDFVVVGGDIAYTNGRRAVYKSEGWELNRWRTFLEEWTSLMLTKEGQMIPMMVVLGNHDIKPTMLAPTPQHFLFYELFALEEKGKPYRVFDVGDYLSLFLLDTGHTYHIEGQQAEWLKKNLFSRENTPYKMAAYHIGAYPSVYSFKGGVPKKIRSEWSPLFEKYRLNVAFEHHNHAYKRTFPMKDERIDPEGVIYIGDGSWGISPRKPKKLWYLDVAEKTNAVCLITLSTDKGIIEGINLKGEIIDTVKTLPTRSMLSWNEGRWIP